MKTLQKNLLWILLVFFNLTMFAQKNTSVQQALNYCPSTYTAALLLEDQIAVENNNDTNFIAAPLFTLQINNAQGNAVALNSLRFSFKIKNYSNGQRVDFENFDYLDESYISDNFSISANNNGYDVEFTSDNTILGSVFLIDDRSSVLIIDILDRLIEFFRGSGNEVSQSAAGYTIEVNNIYFKSVMGGALETCASSIKQTVFIELPSMQKQEGNISIVEKLSNQKFSKINFSPNPATDFIQIFRNNSELNPLIQIYNTNGQLLINNKLTTSNYIDVSYLKKGMYNLLVSDDIGEIRYVKRLLIN